MYLGACRIMLRLPESASLKDKRQVVRSVTTRLRNKFNLSVAEVDGHGRWQIATIGLACVSNDGAHVREQLERAVAFVRGDRLDAELIESEIEVEAAF